MGTKIERDPEGASDIRDTWDDDRPKEVVRLADHTDIAAKLAKLSTGANAGEAWKEREPEVAGAPGMIAAGGVNEAKAYLRGVTPAEHPEHRTIEMRRVEVLDPRKAVTEVIQRPGVLASGGGEDGLVTETVGPPRRDEPVERVSVKAGRGARMLVAGIAIGIVAATVPLFLLFGRQPPRRVLESFPAIGPFAELTPAASALASPGASSSVPAVETAPPPQTSASVGLAATGASPSGPVPQGGVTGVRPVSPKVTAPSRPQPPPEIL